MYWDVFIAYHGTYDKESSKEKAEVIYRYLTENGVSCYYFPKMQNGKFADTPKRAIDCGRFLVVANAKITDKLNSDGRLSESDALYAELDAFYDNRVGNDRSRQDLIRVYAFEGFRDEQADALYPVATHGVEHFDEARDGEARSMENLLNWAKLGDRRDASGTAVEAAAAPVKTLPDASLLEYENLDKILFSDQEIVCRDKELWQLFDYVCGWNGNRVRRNRKHLVCLSAYGGIGKTVLVAEFVEQLMAYMATASYPGFRPKFILFYSAKTERLDYNPYSGKIDVSKMRKQVNDFEALREQFYRDLQLDAQDTNWDIPGILIVDNLETLTPEDRDRLLDFIVEELPSSVSVIVTTRIPLDREVDAPILLAGFPDEKGKEFIREYCRRNNIVIELTDSQQEELLRCSMGNTLVLVLALRRIAEGKSTVRSILEELQRMPKNDKNNAISVFMYQNTVDELLSTHKDLEDQINEVLDCFMAVSELTVDAIVNISRNLPYSDVERIIDLLANYLVVERRGDVYALNEYAASYVLIKRPLDEQRRSSILQAVKRAKASQRNLEEYCLKYSGLRGVIEEWCGDGELEGLAIARAFEAYDDGLHITGSNADYEVDQLRLTFEDIEKKCAAHPYVYWQHARILRKLRRDGYIGDEYDDRIRQNFERCFILLEKPQFSSVRVTKSFPSVLRNFADFLWEIGDNRSAVVYAEKGLKVFLDQGPTSITAQYCNDMRVLYGVALIKLFEEDMLSNRSYLNTARSVYEEAKKYVAQKPQFRERLNELETLIDKYARFR